MLTTDDGACRGAVISKLDQQKTEKREEDRW